MRRTKMAFIDAKPKDQVIKKLKEEQNILNNKVFNIEQIFTNDTNISEKQLGYMEIQMNIMKSLISVLDLRIEDLKTNK